MTVYSYVVARDFGFAPNPFNGICTLATCKARIRQHAAIGDWVVGTGSATAGFKNNLIFCMEVKETLSYSEYWFDPRFASKRPVMNGSLKTMYGDNIYFRDEDGWHQANSHHSLADGSFNQLNIRRDTKANRVLISSNFYYFGKSCVDISTQYASEICKNGIGYKHVNQSVFLEFLETAIVTNYEPGYNGDPLEFSGSFERYDGK